MGTNEKELYTIFNKLLQNILMGCCKKEGRIKNTKNLRK
jgi:hypothetical protein